MDETIISESKISKLLALQVIFKRGMLLLFIVALLFVIIGSSNEGSTLFVIGILMFLLYIIRILLSLLAIEKSKFILTDQRIIFENGKNKNNKRYMPLAQVSGVDIKSSFWGKVFNYGDLYIGNTGSLRFPAVKGIKEATILSEMIHTQINSISR